MEYPLNNLTLRSFLRRVKLLCKKFFKILAVFGGSANTIASPSQAT